MKNFIRLMNLVIVLECLIACGSSKNSSDGSSAASVATPSIDLTGNWSKPCVIEADGTIHKNSIQVSAISLVRQMVIYAMTNCAVPQIVYTITYKYTLGAALPSGGFNFDGVIQSEIVQINDPTMIPAANAKAYWGYTNWTITQLNATTGHKAPDGSIISLGDKEYDIVKISDGALFNGDYATGKGDNGEASRPTGFTTIPYTKK